MANGNPLERLAFGVRRLAFGGSAVESYVARLRPRKPSPISPMGPILTSLRPTNAPNAKRHTTSVSWDSSGNVGLARLPSGPGKTDRNLQIEKPGSETAARTLAVCSFRRTSYLPSRWQSLNRSYYQFRLLAATHTSEEK
jgi:hypothetical protein